MTDLIIRAVFLVLVLGLSAIIHEYAHAWASNRLGDPTAKLMGRLTLNPLPHIDLIGTVLMPFGLFLLTRGGFAFAAARPVPYDPTRLRDPRWDPAKIAVAGPASNFLAAIALGLLFRLVPGGIIGFTLQRLVSANILIGVFNLVPIPPLDGSKLLFAVLPSSLDQLRFTLERLGFFILIMFVVFRGFLIIYPIIKFAFELITGTAFLSII